MQENPSDPPCRPLAVLNAATASGSVQPQATTIGRDKFRARFASVSATDFGNVYTGRSARQVSDLEQQFKTMITGRRRPGMTFAEMRRYMLNVHGPLVVSDDYFRSTYVGRYVQNHVLDAGYGRAAPYARDMVSELSIVDPARLPQMLTEPHLVSIVQPDERSFANLADRFSMPVSEMHIVAPPRPAGRSSEPESFKAMHYLKRSDELTHEQFMDGFRELEGDFLRSPVVNVRGFVRNQPQIDEAPYDLVVSLWFERHRGTDSFDVWLNAVKDAGIVAAAPSFFLFVAEHLIYSAV